jgi:hypothetical protein
MRSFDPVLHPEFARGPGDFALLGRSFAVVAMAILRVRPSIYRLKSFRRTFPFREWTFRKDAGRGVEG